MDNVQRQRENIVLYKDKKDGADYIRIEYAGNGDISQLLVRDADVEMADNGSAYIPAAIFRLSDFYDRYSPHAYIDYSRVYVRHPKPKREYTLPEGYLELLERKRYSPSTIKTYRAYFSDFMEYHKGRNIDRLKVADINKYILYLVNEKKISVSQQNMRINAIKFYYEKVLGQERRCYRVNRAKREKTLPDVLGKDEIKRILDVAAKDLRFFCIFSILYSAGLRISELLELKPGDINESRNLIRVRQGKGKKDRYTLLSRPLMKKLAEYNRLYKPKVWLFEHRPGEPFTESIVSKRLKAAAREAGITKRIYPHLLRHSFATHLLEQGTDIKIVKELMGHNNIKTTERYVHIADTFKSNIKSPLDDLLMEEDEV